MGVYVRARREELGLSQGDVIAALGYVSRNSVSNVETGREGLPAKRVYAWADVLKLPHEGFFRFVTGETKRVEDGEPTRKDSPDAELLATFRKLPPRLQRRARELLRELAAEASTDLVFVGETSGHFATTGPCPCFTTKR